MRLLAALLPLLGGCPPRAPVDVLARAPDPTEVVDVAYYDVAGDTAAQLRAALNRDGPVAKSDGRRYDAVTEWKIAWRFDAVPQGRTCGIGPVQTTVTATLRMPRWVTSDAPAELVARWTSFVTALEAHERGHVAIASEGAERIREGLAALGPQTTCELATSVAHARGHALIDEVRAEQRSYDRETRHGRTQGVHFE